MNVTYALEHLPTEEGLENLKFEIIRQKLKKKGLIKKEKNDDLQIREINEFAHLARATFFKCTALITSETPEMNGA